jgi:hypothetical protein
VRPGEAGAGSSGWASTEPAYPAAEDPSGERLPCYESGTLRQRPGVRYRPEGKLSEAHRGVVSRSDAGRQSGVSVRSPPRRAPS